MFTSFFINFFCIFHVTYSTFLSTNHVRAYRDFVMWLLRGADDVVHAGEQKVNSLFWLVQFALKDFIET